MAEPVRCWASNDDAYNAYHDDEWGRPVTDESSVLERLCLEGFQSGLSWLTILRKRPAFRDAFAAFLSWMPNRSRNVAFVIFFPETWHRQAC